MCMYCWVIQLTARQGRPHPDTLVRMYDVRTLRALPPVSFPAGPSFAQLHPRDPSKLVVASQAGLIQSVDLTGSIVTQFQQLPVNSYVTSMGIGPMGDYLAFGDADGQLHVWTEHETGDNAKVDEAGMPIMPPFNGYRGVKAEWPDQAEAPTPIIWTEET
jgi:PAB-dependent poly(A)-specific ribonuclease subunit 2